MIPGIDALLAEGLQELREQRALKRAAALLSAEMRALRSELGQKPRMGATVAGLTFATPRIHRWAEHVIPIIAGPAPELYQMLRTLDYCLNRYSAFVQQHQRAVLELGEAKREEEVNDKNVIEAIKAVWNQQPQPSFPKFDWQKLKSLTDVVPLLEELRADEHAGALQRIDEIQRKLDELYRAGHQLAPKVETR